MVVSMLIPLRTTTGLNAWEHRWARVSRQKRERGVIALALQRGAFIPHSDPGGGPTIVFPIVVELTRLSPRLADLDNVAGGMKCVRDELAKHLGVDDGDASKVRWLYRQEKGPFGVRVAIHSKSRLETRIVPVEQEAAP